jgi:hypothetical protein
MKCNVLIYPHSVGVSFQSILAKEGYKVVNLRFKAEASGHTFEHRRDYLCGKKHSNAKPFGTYGIFGYNE